MNQKNSSYKLRALALIVIVVTLFTAGIGITGVAAQSSIPGDALYPLKTTLEQTRLSLAQDAAERAQLRMSYAEKRLSEIGSLVREGRFKDINSAVLAFESEINGAIIELETVAKGDPARAARLAMDITSALTRYALTLSDLAANAPASVQNIIARALDSTQIASSLDMPSRSEDNSNTNDDDSNNSNDDDSNDDDSNNSNDDNSNDDDSNNSNDDDSDDDDSDDDDKDDKSNDD